MGYVPHFPPGIRVERVAPGQDARAWHEAITSFDPSRAPPLKADSGVVVSRASLNGRDVVLKARELPSILPRLKQVFHMSRAWRHWRGAAFLERHAIPTARCLALLTERARGGLVVEWLAMEHLAGRTVLQTLSSIHHDSSAPSIRDQHAIARALGQQLAALERAARFNRDHKPSNLIVLEPVSGPTSREPRIAIIDCVAIQRLGKQSWRGVRRMLASLIIEPTGCGIPVRRTLRLRVLTSFLDAQARLPRELRRKAIRGGWSSVAALVAAHGDPTPRIDPLQSHADPAKA
jgi:hypothetical protein